MKSKSKAIRSLIWGISLMLILGLALVACSSPVAEEPAAEEPAAEEPAAEEESK